jgi:hypothetical protein
MADFNASVSLNVNPPDPNQGLNTLNKIMQLGSAGLGIQQQKQALQTGQSIQQSAQAKAQIDTQSAKENQALAGLMSDPVKNGIVDQDGNPTPDAQKIVMQAAPTTGSQHYENIVSAATKKVAFNSAVNNLRSSERAELGQTIAGVTARAEQPSDIIDAIDNLVASKKGTPEAGNYQTIANTAKQAITHMAKQTQGGNPPPPGKEPWKIGAANIASSIAGITPTAQNTGAGLVNRDPVLGGLSQPPGGATGSAINPTPPQVAGATKRQTETGNADIDTSNLVVAAQKDARTNIDLTKRIDQLADIVSPGALPAKVSSGLGALGLQDINQARTELEKDLGRLRGSAGARAGSDSRAAEVLSGLPTAQTPTQTIHQAMDVTRGTARQDLALGQLREKNSAATKGQMNGFQGDYAHATAAASPLMHEYYALSPEEQVGFFQRNFKTKEQAKAFRAQAESVKRLSPDVTGQ